MQWVVTTGRTVADAREAALDVLGIDDSELEFEVLDEPRSRLFGLRTIDARIRARVEPTRPRPKLDRRARKTRRKKDGRPGQRDNQQGKRSRSGRKGAGSNGRSEADDTSPEQAPTATADGSAAPGGRRRQRGGRTPRPTAEQRRAEESEAAPATPERDETSSASSDTTSQVPNEPRHSEVGGTATMSDIGVTEQEPVATDFVAGLIEAFGVEADVASAYIEDDDAVEVQVTGEDLGLLVGPRGATLSSIGELTRTAVAQQLSGRLEGRLRVDIAGYRARRKEALVRFAAQAAEKALESGKPVALEPMSPPDRKIVHDAVNEIDGVSTISRGEDRGRHIVIQPDAS